MLDGPVGGRRALAPATLPDTALPSRPDASTEAVRTDHGDHVALDVRFLPILDVVRGVVAGYQAQWHAGGDTFVPEIGRRSQDSTSDGVDADGSRTAAGIRAALDHAATMPVNTFLTVPVDVRLVANRRVLGALLARPRLDGIVLDLVGTVGAVARPELADAVARCRAAGALIAVGGQGAAQPDLTGIVSLKPAILRLSRDWVRGVDTSTSKRSAIDIIGQLAGQLDAWILAEGVCSASELRALAGLEVPLAQGPFIGSARRQWSGVEANATRALPRGRENTSGGVLRCLTQSAYTSTDATVAIAVLGETVGFDVVVVVDGDGRPQTLLEHGESQEWSSSPVLSVNVETPPADAVQRALARPRATRFTPLACTDDAGRFIGILRMERLMGHLATSA